jgi:N-acyl-D-aspartate/D-glutamate deacylase
MRTARRLLLCTALLLLGACGREADAPAAAQAAFDLLITNATVVDGTGAERYVADVGITDGRIAAVGTLADESAAEVVDAAGMVLAPGFIDVHSHADRALASPETAGMEGFLRQGVTTAVYGIDGFMRLEDLDRYIAIAESGGMGMNFMAFIGHNSVRRAVMGDEDRSPTAAELERMKDIVGEAMERGALGLSSGLMYLPGRYAATEELVELASVAAPYGGIYDSHVRDPANNLLASHQECLDIASAAGVHAHPAHVKAVGASNFGKGPEFVAMIETAIGQGQSVTVDLYPYDGAATRPVIALLYPADDDSGRKLMRQLSALLAGEETDTDIPTLTRDLKAYWQEIADDSARYEQARRNSEEPREGVFSWIDTVGYGSMRIVVSGREEYEGRMVAELAAELDISPFELFRRLAVDEGAGAVVTLGAILEDDLRVILKLPWAMIASDGEELAPSHPRGRGTFARVLGRYVREWGVLTLEDAVYKMSGLPAKYLQLPDRGAIREGAVADIVVFDPERIIDHATWSEPARYAEGVIHVLIGGEFVLRDETPTGSRPGRYIPFAAGSSGKSSLDQASI